MEAWNEITRRFNKDALLLAASSIANGLPCVYDSPPMCRRDWMILRIHFPTVGNRWAARIPRDQQCSFYAIAIQPLEFVAHNCPKVPAPRIHGYVDVEDTDNPVGVAYMLIDWIDGTPMQPWTLDYPTVARRHKVLTQLADIILELLSVTKINDGIHFYGTLFL
jgi:aminoglycoside phosphotransferase (APT) family kinase protein